MPSRREHKPSSIGGPSEKTGRTTLKSVSKEELAILNKARNTCDASQNPIHGQRRRLSILVTDNIDTSPHGHVFPQSPPQSDADLPGRLQSSRGVPKPRVTIQEQDNENACESSDGSGNSGDSDSSGNRGSKGFFAGDGTHFPKSDLGTRPGSRERRTSTLTALFKTRPASKTTADSQPRASSIRKNTISCFSDVGALSESPTTMNTAISASCFSAGRALSASPPTTARGSSAGSTTFKKRLSIDGVDSDNESNLGAGYGSLGEGRGW